MTEKLEDMLNQLEANATTVKTLQQLKPEGLLLLGQSFIKPYQDHPVTKVFWPMYQGVVSAFSTLQDVAPNMYSMWLETLNLSKLYKAVEKADKETFEKLDLVGKADYIVQRRALQRALKAG